MNVGICGPGRFEQIAKGRGNGCYFGIPCRITDTVGVPTLDPVRVVLATSYAGNQVARDMVMAAEGLPFMGEVAPCFVLV